MKIKEKICLVEINGKATLQAWENDKLVAQGFSEQNHEYEIPDVKMSQSTEK